MGVRSQRCMERHHIALPQQHFKRHILGGRRATAVKGQHAAAEPAQPVHHGHADASCPDHADGQVAELPSRLVVQPVIVDLGTTDGGFGVSHHHQHQQHRVVGHAVGRVGDILNGNASPCSACHVDVVVADASRGDVLHASSAKREKNGFRKAALVADADATIPKGQSYVRFRHRRIRESWRRAIARSHLPEQHGLVLPASINRDADAWGGGLLRSSIGNSRRGPGHTRYSSGRDVASMYRVFDTPTIWPVA